ncbi:SAM-dependent methyltransferase [Streptomyces sp. NPDC048172]|uniref:SAM-dependent methyltransferase n=1 Tax=Streptomyces sp. NPDC048172 TaxID=3365505 RepID=UPI00371F52E5
MSTDPVGWREAMRRALYGPGGFFTREAPGDHFRTSVHASPLFARAVATLLRRVDGALGHPERLDLVDMGAGRGELLSGVLAALEEREGLGAVGADASASAHGDGADDGDALLGEDTDDPDAPDGAADLLRRLRPCAVERGPRPDGLDPRVEWRSELPGPGTLTGLLFANEWLDNVPVDVVENGADGTPRLVLTDSAGNERPGDPPGPEDTAWLARWWPLEAAGPGARAEVGHPRDAAWSAAVRTLRRGAAVAVDYGHTRETRPPFGTLTGFRAGREIAPVPDGTGDLTAHVALDAVAAACAGPGTGTEVLGAEVLGTEVLSQRDALHALGVNGSRPPLAQASSDPAAYVRALASAGEAAELTDPRGLGGFGWLVCGVGIAPPLP